MTLEDYLKVLDEGYYEVKFAFEGLADENVWKRPSAGLLSVGEMAGHIAYWEAVRLAAGGREPEPDSAEFPVSSPLLDQRFRYYPTNIATPPSEAHRAMTAEQVCDELLRVHSESVAHFKALNPDLDSSPPGHPPNQTYRAFLMYAAFHIAYHTGQMFSVRHLLSEETPDN